MRKLRFKNAKLLAHKWQNKIQRKKKILHCTSLATDICCCDPQVEGWGILRRESGNLVILSLFLHVPVIEDWVIQVSFPSEKNFSKLYKIVWTLFLHHAFIRPRCGKKVWEHRKMYKTLVGFFVLGHLSVYKRCLRGWPLKPREHCLNLGPAKGGNFRDILVFSL